MFDWLFLRHPRSVGESYFEHCATALSFAGELLVDSLACCLHAFVPAFFPRTASRAVAALHQRMLGNRRQSKSVTDFDYAI